MGGRKISFIFLIEKNSQQGVRGETGMVKAWWDQNVETLYNVQELGFII